MASPIPDQKAFLKKYDRVETFADYDDFRAKVYPKLKGRPLNLLFASGNYRLSRLTQELTSSVWSHCALVLYVEAIDRYMVLETVEYFGTRLVPLASYALNCNDSGKPYDGFVGVAETNFPALNFIELGRFGTDQLIRSYDYKALVGTGVLEIAAAITREREELGLVGRVADITDEFMRRHWETFLESASENRQQPSYVCSNLVADCLKNGGYTVIPRNRVATGGLVSPDDVWLDEHVSDDLIRIV